MHSCPAWPARGADLWGMTAPFIPHKRKPAWNAVALGVNMAMEGAVQVAGREEGQDTLISEDRFNFWLCS